MRGNDVGGCRVGNAAVRLVLAALLLSVALLGRQIHAAIPDSERQVLISIYNSMDGPNWSQSDGWMGSPGSECGWYGVHCNDGQTHISGIQLNDINMGGQIPDLSGLSEVQVISFMQNDYTSTGRISGPIPNLSTMGSLKYFHVAGHMLSGSLPSAESIPDSLTWLIVGRNSLTGSVPDYSARPNFWQLEAYSNQLSGTLPVAKKISNMRVISLENNRFSGAIPTPFAGPSIISYDVRENSLSGQLPDFDSYPALRAFHAADNHLSGVIPSLSQLPRLQILNLRNNALSGSIPSLDANPLFNTFDVSINELTGSLPSFENNKFIQYICAYNNQLSGEMPRSISHLEGLIIFDVHTNNLSGAISSVVGLAGLRQFDVSHNSLTGTPPRFSGNWSLEAVSLEGNKLSGQIPPFEADLFSLGYYNASFNELSGSFPDFSGPPLLKTVLISHNQFDGPIPSLAALPLHSLVAGYNAFTGDPPDLPPNWAAGYSRLCPNSLNPVPSADWDAATGIAPWYRDCADGLIFRTSFEEYEDQR